MIAARLPAISDIEVSTGARPRSSSIASRPTAVIARSMSARTSAGRAVGSAQKATTIWWGCSSSYSAGSGLWTQVTSSARRNGSDRPNTTVAPAD